MTFYTNRADIISLVFYQTLVNIVLLIASLISQSYIRPKKIFYIGNMPQETVEQRNTLEDKIFVLHIQWDPDMSLDTSTHYID